MRRFFYATNADNYPKLNSLTIGNRVELTEAITHHWCRVLRANSGDQGVLFDGFGGEYLVELTTISKKQATATLLAHSADDHTASVISKIALVMSRGERMDYAIQKATELGVTAIQLLTSHHGEVTLKPAQVDKKLEHWQQIAISACEQCGLNRPPLILAPVAISQWLQSFDTELSIEINNDSNDNAVLTDKALSVSSIVAKLSQDSYYQVLCNQADIKLMLSVPSDDQPLTPATLSSVLTQSLPYIELLIGPEGGLSPTECQQAEQVDFLPWQIGNRVLRTETAPVVALATLQALSHY
ncbi:MAG: 16S rRNA (uracil(1498)-N(3))-methyltransferase [Psychrobacter sp.]|nr:16S rRNA (uracil(1498)-N(3))-methyltransferase [Psychrobacter sp.]